MNICDILYILTMRSTWVFECADEWVRKTQTKKKNYEKFPKEIIFCYLKEEDLNSQGSTKGKYLSMGRTHRVGKNMYVYKN